MCTMCTLLSGPRASTAASPPRVSVSRNNSPSDRRYKANMDPNVYDTENPTDDGDWPEEDRRDD